MTVGVPLIYNGGLAKLLHHTRRRCETSLAMTDKCMDYRERKSQKTKNKQQKAGDSQLEVSLRSAR
jgi:hypothetical protein